MKKYSCHYYVDVLLGNTIIAEKIITGSYSCYCGSWKEFLCFLWGLVDESIFHRFGHNFYNSDYTYLIGVSHCDNFCDEKVVNFNYINRVISKDAFLRKVYWY